MSVNNSANNLMYGDGNPVPSGAIGEYISSSILISLSVPLVSGVSKNITSIILTPGLNGSSRWEVRGLVAFNPSLLTTSTSMLGGLNTVSNTFPIIGAENNSSGINLSISAGQSVMNNIGPMSLTVSVNTTIYLIGYSTFILGTMSVYGFISATRVS